MAAKVKEKSGAAKAGSARRRPQRKREPGKTTISSKNQVTIPVDALRKAGFAAGDRLIVRVDSAGEIRLTRADESPEELVRRLAGGFEGCYPPGYLADLRKDWEGRF